MSISDDKQRINSLLHTSHHAGVGLDWYSCYIVLCLVMELCNIEILSANICMCTQGIFFKANVCWIFSL